MVRDRDEQYGAAQDSLQNLSVKESSGAAKSCSPGFSSKRYTFCFKNMLQMEKHKTYVINTCQKYIEKHLLEQWFVIAKSRSALPRNTYKTKCVFIVLEMQIRVVQDLHQNATLFALKPCSKCKNTIHCCERARKSAPKAFVWAMVRDREEQINISSKPL